uniref:Selenide, water dikinase n=1 Tax=Paramoeba aestuarina TaxID=180227 RepID=A0A7S4L8K4_9EUKA|mmetsp:Transcript_33286/g.52033  ORF Transcript_33286/g.52033 Transcript_33286/m.52033 type:complete len:307 (+) Transcript_33286:208-1128(+)
MDCSIVPHSVYPDLFTLSTTDFFYPLVDDPYMQGRIACANVLSDMYSLGIPRCDNMLMLLGGSTKMGSNERDIVMKRMIQGFSQLAEEAGTKVTGGQTVLNEWPLIGGVAMTTAKEGDFIRPEHLVPGDVLVLTKPIGTQVAVNLHEWILDPKHWKRAEGLMTAEDELQAYNTATESMARLNITGAKLMQKYKAHGCTDITGFGILGHASNLAANQTASIDIELHTLPIIRNMAKVDKEVKMFKLLEGYSAETSGGLLVALGSMEDAVNFCKEIQEIDGKEAWVVGNVVEGKGKARIIDDVKVVEV